MRREETLGCLLHQSPKFYHTVFLFVAKQHWRLLWNWLVGSLSWVSKTLIVIYKRGNFMYIQIFIGNLYQFGHCLISLDPLQLASFNLPHNRDKSNKYFYENNFLHQIIKVCFFVVSCLNKNDNIHKSEAQKR